MFSSFEKPWCLHKPQQRFEIGRNLPSCGTYFPISRKKWPNLAKLQFFTEFFTLYKLCSPEDSLEFDTEDEISVHHVLPTPLWTANIVLGSSFCPGAAGTEGNSSCSWRNSELVQLYPVLTGTCEECKGYLELEESCGTTQKRVGIFQLGWREPGTRRRVQGILWAFPGISSRTPNKA